MKKRKELINEMIDDYQRKIIHNELTIEIYEDMLENLPDGEQMTLMGSIAGFRGQNLSDNKMLLKLKERKRIYEKKT